MLLKKLSIIVAFVLVSTSLFSQENFLKGYIIIQNGDTVRGFIDYRNWSKNPQKINFKTTVKDEPQFFSPLEIKEFVVKDEIYKGAIVKVENSNIKTLSNTLTLSFRTDTVFLQAFFQGPKSLYYYKDNFDQDNFYIYNNSQFELLEFKKYIKMDEAGHEFLLTNKRFIGQLRFYLNDCPDIDSKLKQFPYEPKSMTNLFKYYYSKMKTEKFTTRTHETIKTEFGVVIGINMIDLRFLTNKAVFDPLPKAKFDNSISPIGGLSVNFVLPRNNGKWSIYNELIYSRYNTNAVYNKFTSNENYEIHHYNADYSYAKINNMVRYKYPIGKMNVFANAGVSYGLIVAEMNSDSINRRYNGTSTSFVQKLIANSPSDNSFNSKKIELGFLVGLGANYKNIFTELRLEAGTGFSPYLALNITATRYIFLVGYRF